MVPCASKAASMGLKPFANMLVMLSRVLHALHTASSPQGHPVMMMHTYTHTTRHSCHVYAFMSLPQPVLLPSLPTPIPTPRRPHSCTAPPHSWPTAGPISCARPLLVLLEVVKRTQRAGCCQEACGHELAGACKPCAHDARQHDGGGQANRMPCLWVASLSVRAQGVVAGRQEAETGQQKGTLNGRENAHTLQKHMHATHAYPAQGMQVSAVAAHADCQQPCLMYRYEKSQLRLAHGMHIPCTLKCSW